MFRLVAVFDLKANVFHQPFAVSASIVAARQFRNVIIHKEGNMISEFPEDFELRDLGSFDELEGKFVQTKIETIETGKNVLKNIAAAMPVINDLQKRKERLAKVKELQELVPARDCEKHKRLKEEREELENGKEKNDNDSEME